MNKLKSKSHCFLRHFHHVHVHHISLSQCQTPFIPATCESITTLHITSKLSHLAHLFLANVVALIFCSTPRISDWIVRTSRAHKTQTPPRQRQRQTPRPDGHTIECGEIPGSWCSGFGSCKRSYNFPIFCTVRARSFVCVCVCVYTSSARLCVCACAYESPNRTSLSTPREYTHTYILHVHTHEIRNNHIAHEYCALARASQTALWIFAVLRSHVRCGGVRLLFFPPFGGRLVVRGSRTDNNAAPLLRNTSIVFCSFC